MTPDELSAKVAEIVGDEGFWPGSCPQGHLAADHCSKTDVGSTCPTCLYGAAHEAAEAYPRAEYWNHRGDAERRLRSEDHPEWRIGRGEPKPYAESLDLLVPVVEAWCKRRGMQAQMGMFHAHWAATIDRQPAGAYLEAEEGVSPATALAAVFLAAVKRWGA